jgi:hypothetical protein
MLRKEGTPGRRDVNNSRTPATAEKPIASINSKNNTDDTTAGPQQHQNAYNSIECKPYQRCQQQKGHKK